LKETRDIDRSTLAREEFADRFDMELELKLGDGRIRELLERRFRANY
jgi:hypothetical protein